MGISSNNWFEIIISDVVSLIEIKLKFQISSCLFFIQAVSFLSLFLTVTLQSFGHGGAKEEMGLTCERMEIRT